MEWKYSILFLLHFLLFVNSQATYTQNFTATGAFTVFVDSLLSAQDVVVWQLNPSDNIILQTTVFQASSTLIAKVIQTAPITKNILSISVNWVSSSLSSSSLKQQKIDIIEEDKNVQASAYCVTIVHVPLSVYQTCDSLIGCAANARPQSGICHHFTSPLPGEMQMLDQAFKTARTDFVWSTMEQQKGVYDFSDWETLYSTLSPGGVTPFWIVDYGNPIYNSWAPPNNTEGQIAMKNWYVASLQQFHGKGIIWEMYNEPNGGTFFWQSTQTAWPYRDIFCDLIGQAGRAAYPNEVQVGPATIGIGSPDWMGIVLPGCLKYWNLVTIHPYRADDRPEWNQLDFSTTRQLIRKFTPEGSLPLQMAASEIGYPTSTGNVNETVQAQFLTRLFLTNVIMEMPITNWYDWHDDGTLANYTEDNYGTVNYAYNKSANPVYKPKLSYLAALALNGNLAGYRYSKIINVDYNGNINLQPNYVVMYVIDDVKSSLAPYVFVCWTINYSSTISFAVDSNQDVLIKDMFGNVVEKKSTNGGNITLNLSESPIYVIVPQRSDYLEILAKTPRLPVDYVNIGASPVSMPVPVYNPLSSSINVMISGSSTSWTTIPPGQTTILAAIGTNWNAQCWRTFTDVLIQGMPKLPLQNYIVSDLRWNFNCTQISSQNIPCGFYTTPGALAVGANFISNVYCSNSSYHSPVVVQSQKFTFSESTTYQAVNLALPSDCEGGKLSIYANVTMISLMSGRTELIIPTFQAKM